MSQDLREMFKRIDSVSEESMTDGHEQRFLKRMEKELPMAKRAAFPLYKIAAALIILFGLGALIFIKLSVPGPMDATVVEKGTAIPEEKGISLGDLSPDLKKVENYYMVNINLELSQLKISDRNKALIDSFMERLEELNVEYKKLNNELNEIGPNDQTITALIKNLQLRLQLLHKLRDKLQELKKISNEEGKNDLITSV